MYCPKEKKFNNQNTMSPSPLPWHTTDHILCRQPTLGEPQRVQQASWPRPERT